MSQSIAEKVGLATASEYQIDIFNHIDAQICNYNSGESVESLMVNAVPGSGKTTSIVHAANLIPKKLNSIFLAFNKDIATELKNRLPSHVESKTLNALGWGISKRYADGMAGRSIDFKDFTNGFKIHNLLREMFPKSDVFNFGADVRWLVGMCQGLGVVPSTRNDVIAANGLDDSDASFNSILETFDHFVDYTIRPTVFNMARQVLNETIEKFHRDHVINFDEQKYFPVVLRMDDGSRLPSKKYDVVIIDEVQDVNAVDIELIKLVLKPGGFVVGVGDNRQAIYGFRGADAQAMTKFKKAFDATSLPLSISYRCANKIVEHARTIYPEIEAAPNAADGAIVSHGEYGVDIFNPEDMILCRNNAPIVSFAYKLISARIPVFVKGRDIGRNLLTIIDKLKATDVEDLNFQLRIWHEQQVRMAIDNNPDDEDAIQRISDKYDTINVFIRGNADGKVETIRHEIETLFSIRTKDSDDARLMKGKVVLSTIHKAKGLEADTVYFLDDFLMFPRWIKEGSSQEIQEKNLMFVAVTRPKNTLAFIASKKLKT